jgi:1-acyl-sn-glycerol-3-phosphate acyltransferase
MSTVAGQGADTPVTAKAAPLTGHWGRAPLGAWRLLRVVGHILSGVGIVFTRWDAFDAARKRAETIRWSGRMIDLLGVKLTVTGQAHAGAKLIVANHISWLDIVTLNSVEPSRFVSKAEVGQWPVVGKLVDAAGTLYLVRERRRDAARVLGLMAQALRDGATVAVFPEGTTGDGHGVLHFHPNLVQAAIDADVPVQPVVLRYSNPGVPVSSDTAYIGDTTLLQSLWRVVTAKDLCVHVHILPAQQVTHADRRALTTQLHAQIEACLADGVKAANGSS